MTFHINRHLDPISIEQNFEKESRRSGSGALFKKRYVSQLQFLVGRCGYRRGLGSSRGVGATPAPLLRQVVIHILVVVEMTVGRRSLSPRSVRGTGRPVDSGLHPVLVGQVVFDGLGQVQVFNLPLLNSLLGDLLADDSATQVH